MIVEAGLPRPRDHRQDEEIRQHLKLRFGLELPASSVGHLANSFLDGLAAIHQAAAPLLRQRLQQDGGYALHVDGTCEAERGRALHRRRGSPRGWTLETAQMSSAGHRGDSQSAPALRGEIQPSLGGDAGPEQEHRPGPARSDSRGA